MLCNLISSFPNEFGFPTDIELASLEKLEEIIEQTNQRKYELLDIIKPLI